MVYAYVYIYCSCDVALLVKFETIKSKHFQFMCILPEQTV